MIYTNKQYTSIEDLFNESFETCIVHEGAVWDKIKSVCTAIKKFLLAAARWLKNFVKNLFMKKNTSIGYKQDSTSNSGENGITKSFYDAVNSNKILRVRIMMKDSLLIDPSFKQFSAMEKYATEHIKDFYDEHDGEELNYDESQWTDDYMDRCFVKAMHNFSHERIDHLKKLVSHHAKQLDRWNSKSAEEKIKDLQIDVTYTDFVLSRYGDIIYDLLNHGIVTDSISNIINIVSRIPSGNDELPQDVESFISLTEKDIWNFSIKNILGLGYSYEDLQSEDASEEVYYKNSKIDTITKFLTLDEIDNIEKEYNKMSYDIANKINNLISKIEQCARNIDQIQNQLQKSNLREEIILKIVSKISAVYEVSIRVINIVIQNTITIDKRVSNINFKLARRLYDIISDARKPNLMDINNIEIYMNDFYVNNRSDKLSSFIRSLRHEETKNESFSLFENVSFI